MRDKFSQKTFDGQECRDDRDKIFGEFKEAVEWLDYESDGAQTKVFLDKLKRLKQISFDLFNNMIQALKANQTVTGANGTETVNETTIDGIVNGIEAGTQGQTQAKANETLGLEAEEQQNLSHQIHILSHLIKNCDYKYYLFIYSNCYP